MNKLNEKCGITGETADKGVLIPAESVRKTLLDFIQRERPEFSDSVFISEQALKDFRRRYLQKLMEEEDGQLDQVEKQVIDAIANE